MNSVLSFLRNYSAAIFIFFALFHPLMARADNFGHVALFECDQKSRLIKLRFLAKGDRKIIADDIMKVQSVYIFNKQTLPYPEEYQLFLVRLNHPSKNGIQRQITWIDRGKPLTSELKKTSIDNATIDKILAFEKTQESNPKVGMPSSK